MSSLRIKKSFLRRVQVSDVMEELKANNYFENAHREMMASFKDSLEYKQMKEVAVKHMFDALATAAQMPDAETREEKKKQIARIGFLALQINTSLAKTISERLDQEAKITTKRALKRLSDKLSRSSDSVSNKRIKRKQNDPEISRTNEPTERSKEEDSDSEVSLDGISERSVSSVHTSDLSSFDDEIVVSSEDEKGERKEKRISFKTANKAYFDDGFSKIRKVISREKSNPNEFSEKSETDEELPKTSKKSIAPKDNTLRPQRERKPNSKYSAEELYF